MELGGESLVSGPLVDAAPSTGAARGGESRAKQKYRGARRGGGVGWTASVAWGEGCFAAAQKGVVVGNGAEGGAGLNNFLY